MLESIVELYYTLAVNEWFWDIVNFIRVSIITYIALKLNNFWYSRHKNKYGKQVHIKFLHQVIACVVIIMAIYNVLVHFEFFKQFIGIIVTSSSLLVVILGFAAQEALGNMLNGLFISIFKPFDIGDRVKLVSMNLTGVIEDITLRHTVLRNAENKRLVIPNSKMNIEIIENSNLKEDAVCNFLDIDVAFDTDFDLAMETIRELVREHKYFKDRRTEEEKANNKDDVQIFAREIGPNSVILRTHIWTDTTGDNFEMCSDLRISIIKKFREMNIEIPYQTITLMGNNVERIEEIGDGGNETKFNENTNV